MVEKYTNMPAGAAFDRAYMKDMVKDHEADVADFQKEANSGTDPGLKEFAGATLPTLQDHLKMAKDIESALGATSSKSK
jgi:putative membrane protein